MKKTIATVLAALLLVSALTGCGRKSDDTVEPTPGINNNDNTVVPEDDNGIVNDGDGIIGDNGATQTDVPDDGVLPEIGSDIENGVDDVIDGVGDAIDGSDNNAANPGDAARGRARVR